MLSISVNEQLEDFLTKPLGSPKLNAFVSKLNIYHDSTCGKILKNNKLDKDQEGSTNNLQLNQSPQIVK